MNQLYTRQGFMRGRSRGFTLIELLVVVLIIGILAAIALPQYRKAVEKSKATQAQTLLKDLKDATELYELETNQWPSSLEMLDISIPADFQPTNQFYAVWHFPKQALSNGEWQIQLHYDTSVNFTGNCHKTIGIVRASGPFEGAGFTYLRCGTYDAKWIKKTWCFEPSTWEGSKIGSYCKNIIGKTEKHIVLNYAFI